MNFNIRSEGNNVLLKIDCLPFACKKNKFKFFLIMKLTVLLMTAFCLKLSAAAWSQQITIRTKNEPFKNVIERIGQQGGCSILADVKEISNAHSLSLNLKNVSLKQALDACFESQPFTYQLIDKAILITARKQQQLAPVSWVLNGKVVSETGEPIAGASAYIKGTRRGASTDVDGRFIIEIDAATDSLVVTSVGYKEKIIAVGNAREMTIILELDLERQKIEEIVIVGFGKQKKKNLVGAVTTVNVKELKGPTSNLTTMLAGRIAGVISYQRSGEPGADNAQFFVRGLGSFGGGKVDPLILIDGIESSNTDLARLQPDDISSFSVLKDATAAAVYGARGANGVMLVSTKLGVEGKTKFDFRAENSISSNTSNFQMADNITYMKLANEGALTRDPLAALPYSQAKIDYTERGLDPLLYPSNDWMNLMIKDYTMNQRFNTSITGGGRVAKYYIAGTYNIDNGVLKNNSSNKFGNNIKLRNYSIRANNTLNVTKTTEMIIRVSGQFDDYQGPIGGGTDIFNSVLKANPVAFPVMYPAELSPFTSHPMFGNSLVTGSSSVLYTNPYANMVSGYQRYSTSTINAQFQVQQDLRFILQGLSARAMAYVYRYARFASQRRYSPFYYRASNIDGATNLIALNDGGPNSVGATGREYLDYTPGDKDQTNRYYTELSANYAHKFGNKHDVNGMLVGILQNSLVSYYHLNDNNNETLEASLPKRNTSLSGRFQYIYDSRYLTEFNFGYNASERFAQNHRWGFFPSIGVAWSVSNEEFFSGLKDHISNLKLRASYGLVGNDAIGNDNDRFFYMSNVNLNNGDYGARFGTEWNYYRPGVSISRYANDQIGWEESRQLNFGLDLTLYGIDVVVEAYRQKRSHILMARSYIPGTLGLQAGMSANVGEAESEGIDIGVNYNKNFSNSMWTQLRANVTYARNKATVYDEVVYPDNEWYRSHVGYPVTQQWGYIAERLFVDDDEVSNSPTQFFGSGSEAKYGAGDIKYRDVNKDGVINEADRVPIGLPTSPEIIYGFGGTFGYKSFDISAFFQGSARSSFFISPSAISPFVTDGGKQNGLLNVIAEDHWSEDNRNLYAFWPRLSNIQNNNNNQTSTWWLRDGAFLRLKTVELGYVMPSRILPRIGLSNLRIYLNATNLFVISKFKTWDPEMGGNGLGYPVQRVYNIGINLGL
ncbi:TonB-dependent receptor [Niabella aquatica]